MATPNRPPLGRTGHITNGTPSSIGRSPVAAATSLSSSSSARGLTTPTLASSTAVRPVTATSRPAATNGFVSASSSMFSSAAAISHDDGHDRYDNDNDNDNESHNGGSFKASSSFSRASLLASPAAATAAASSISARSTAKKATVIGTPVRAVPLIATPVRTSAASSSSSSSLLSTLRTPTKVATLISPPLVPLISPRAPVIAAAAASSSLTMVASVGEGEPRPHLLAELPSSLLETIAMMIPPAPMPRDKTIPTSNGSGNDDHKAAINSMIVTNDDGGAHKLCISHLEFGDDEDKTVIWAPHDVLTDHCAVPVERVKNRLSIPQKSVANGTPIKQTPVYGIRLSSSPAAAAASSQPSPLSSSLLSSSSAAAASPLLVTPSRGNISTPLSSSIGTRTAAAAPATGRSFVTPGRTASSSSSLLATPMSGNGSARMTDDNKKKRRTDSFTTPRSTTPSSATGATAAAAAASHHVHDEEDDQHVSTNDSDAAAADSPDRLASLRKRLTDLNHELVSLRERKAANERHIHALHAYNEVKDVAQMLLGKLAEYEGTVVKELYPRFDIELDD